jgi:hypothetical protein
MSTTMNITVKEGSKEWVELESKIESHFSEIEQALTDKKSTEGFSLIGTKVVSTGEDD